MAIKQSIVISQQSIVTKFLLFTVYCSLFTVLLGCASLSQKEDILAVVDGEPITEGDLKYALNIAHRREDLSTASALNLSEYVQKLIDDRLIVDEARRMGIDQYPEVKDAIQAYILRESVAKLFDEEIAKKISLTEEDIVNFYKKNYERLTIGLIEVNSEEQAKEILKQLEKGGDFKELVQKYSTHAFKKDSGEVVFTRRSMPSNIEETVSHLIPGEFSDVIKISDKYYIVKLIDKKEASDEELKNVKGSIERTIRKQKEKERSDEYLKYLREKANIKIDRELLSTIKLDGTNEEIERWSKDQRPLVEVDGSILTVKDFVSIATPYTRKSSEDILNSWIDRKVVDHEALKRHYEVNSDLKQMIYCYENQLLKKIFIQRIVVPRVVISEEVLKEYYFKNKKNYTSPTSFKIQQITVKSMDIAQSILNNIQSGADFSWIAKTKSTDSAGPKGGDAGWVTKSDLPTALREIVDTLKPGDISPIVKIDSSYMIIKIQEKKEGEVEEFDKVKGAVYRACFEEQLKNLLNKYVAQLKTEAQIRIYDEKVQSLEEKLQK